MKVAVKLRYHDPDWETYIKKLKEVTDAFILYDFAINTAFPDVEILITTHIERETLPYFPSLKAIFLFKTGMDGLPLDELKRRNIKVVCSHANADLVAEHAVALALAVLHRIPEFDRDLRRGMWSSNGSDYSWKSISSYHIGILGFGHIGRSLYQKLLSLNSDIMVLNKSGKYPENVKSAGSFEELTEKCNLLFICVPATEETIGMFDEKVLSNMKKTYIVNVSRAEIFKESDLYEAVSRDRIAGYASDVWFRQPSKTRRNEILMPSGCPFELFDRVVMSPHCAAHEVNAHERYIRSAVESCISYLQSGETE